MEKNTPSGDIVTIGSGTQLNFHELQDIYNSLTGKTESISKALDSSYKLKFEDFEQLNARINQCCDSYGARIKNESISIFHINGAKETFSSFERFKLYNKSNTSPTENIYLEYNILITPAGSVEIRKYKISFNFPSRVGGWEKQPELSGDPLGFMHFLGLSPARVKIEYVDYAAARHFLSQIDEWHNALEVSHERKWFQKIQAHSHLCRYVIPFLSVSFLFYSLSRAATRGNLPQILDSIQFSQLYLVTSIGLASWLIFGIISRVIEMSIDRIQPISYIKSIEVMINVLINGRIEK
jgi:hypothetical protein